MILFPKYSFFMQKEKRKKKKSSLLLKLENWKCLGGEGDVQMICTPNM